MTAPWVLALFVAVSPGLAPLFDAGEAFERFVSRVSVLRARWTVAPPPVPPHLVGRLRRAAAGLRLLVVAEDWCVDSANTVPHLAGLAAAAGVPLRIVGRAAGEDALDAHRTPDGRVATPLVVLLRDGRDEGAWIERPVALQRAFREMAASPAAAAALADRQVWYDRDGGRSALEEIVSLVERSGGGR